MTDKLMDIVLILALMMYVTYYKIEEKKVEDLCKELPKHKICLKN